MARTVRNVPVPRGKEPFDAEERDADSRGPLYRAGLYLRLSREDGGGNLPIRSKTRESCCSDMWPLGRIWNRRRSISITAAAVQILSVLLFGK